jgi:hypothetical protein
LNVVIKPGARIIFRTESVWLHPEENLRRIGSLQKAERTIIVEEPTERELFETIQRQVVWPENFRIS